MKVLLNICGIFALLFSCKQEVKTVSTESISDVTQQRVIFQKVTSLFSRYVPNQNIDDSISILLLPIQRICASCRKKIIDSIVGNRNRLDRRHFIIISANGGRKTVDAFFRERGHSLPTIPEKLFIDSTDEAYKKDLYKDKPVTFYGFDRKVYKKVSSLPITVTDDLREFFSGSQNNADPAENFNSVN